MPAEERQGIRLDDAALNGELLRMTDAYTDELFPRTPVEAGRVIFPVSRLISLRCRVIAVRLSEQPSEN